MNRPHFLTQIRDESRDIATYTAVFDTTTNRLIGLVNATGQLLSINYTTDLPNGQTSQVMTDALQHTTEIVRDAQGNVVRQIDQVGDDQYLVTVHQYDAQGNETAVSNPTQVPGAQRYTWTPSDFATQTVYGDTNNPNLPTKETDANGNPTAYIYDANGNVISTTTPLGSTVDQWDTSTGQLKESIDRSGGVSTYGYDGHGNVKDVEEIKNDGTSSTAVKSTYDAIDELQSLTDASGQETDVFYDTSGRQNAAQYTDASHNIIRKETNYDNDGRIIGTTTKVNGAVVTTTSMTYDAAGRVLTSTDEFNKTTTTLYDANENPVQRRVPAKDENGNSVVVVVDTAYDADGRQIAQSDPYLVNATPSGDVLITPLANLRVTYAMYDFGGRVTEVRRLGGLRITVNYISGGESTSVHVGGLFQSAFPYDPVANTYGTDPAPTIIYSNQTHYDAVGQVASTTSETGLVTNYQYDPIGNQTQMSYTVNGVQSVTSYKYDADGNQIQMTDPADRVTSYVYDDLGQLISTIRRGILPTGTNPGDENPSLDVTTQTVYDELGRSTADIDALGRRTDYQYDTGGRLIAVTLPPVDPTGSATGTINMRRPRYEYHYDNNGRESYVVSNIYQDDAAQQVTYLTRDASGSEHTFTRAMSDAAWPTDKGDVTSFTYDSEGRRLTDTLPLGNQSAGAGSFISTNVYDTSASNAHGELQYSIDFSGRVTGYTYDNSPTGGGRVSAVRYYSSFSQYPNSPDRTISTTYDAFGRLKIINDSAFSTPTTYTYDADGRITKIDSSEGTLHYAYDNVGRKTATWTGAGDTLADAVTQATTLTEYGYDQLNRLTSTTAVRRFGQNVDVDPNQSGVQPENTTTVFAADGQIDYEQFTTASGTVTEKDSYDSQSRIQEIQDFNDANGNHVYDTGDTLLSQIEYTYNKDDSRASETVTDQNGHVTATNWTYDGEGRVSKEVLSGFDDASNPIAYTDIYKYDFSSNRIVLDHTDQTPGGTPGSDGPSDVITSTYDGNDRLLSEANRNKTDDSKDTFTTFAYGPGNANSDQASSTTYPGLTISGTFTQQTTYSYDAMGNMSGATATVTNGNTTTSVSYAYDANGFRVEQTQNGVRTVYLVDPENPTGYSQVLEEGTDNNNNHKLDAAEVQKAYTLGMKVLAQATATQVLHLITDAHGSTKAVLDLASGPTAAAIKQRYAYSAYGEDLGLTTPLTAVRYAGQMIDPITGLSYNRARWYNPATGQFTQRDSFGGQDDDPITLNKYLYGNGNPVSGVDPSGNETLAELMTTTGEEEKEEVEEVERAAYLTGQTVKMLVRFALLEMEFTVMRLTGLLGEGEEFFATGYYFYEWLRFEKHFAGKKMTMRLAGSAPKIAGYLKELPNGQKRLFDAQYNGVIKRPKGGFLLPQNKGFVYEALFMPLTGTREKDNALASAIVGGLKLYDLFSRMRNGDVAGAEQELERIGNEVVEVSTGEKTWHHNEVMGVMELILSIKNHGKGAQGHTGGAKFWALINDKPSYG